MSVWDTFKKLGFFQSEEEDSEEEMDENEIQDQDEEEEEDESQTSRFAFFSGAFRRSASSHAAQQEEEDASEQYEEPPVRTTKRGNVIHDSRMNGRANPQEPAYTHRIHVIVVRQIEECRGIIQFLLQGDSVMLNLENIDPKDCARVVDLLSGAAFALDGRLMKVAHLSYLLAPQPIQILEDDLPRASAARYR